MKILEKDKKKKDQGTCVRKRNAFSALHDSPFNDDKKQKPKTEIQNR